MTRKPYLFKHRGGGFCFHVEKDISAVKSGEPYWVKPQDPAYEYLFGRPASPNYHTHYLGAFPTDYAPAPSQVSAIKHAQTEPLTAVQGPPGSGKTTLILHLIAQQVVRRAVALIEDRKDINSLTVISSTNGKAVENVIERIDKDLSSRLGQFFCLNGGNKETIHSSDGAAAQLRNAIHYFREADYDREKHRDLAREIKWLKRALCDDEKVHKEHLRSHSTDTKQRRLIANELDQIARQLQEIKHQKDVVSQQLSRLSYLQNLPEKSYRRLKLQFSVTKMQLPEENLSWWSKVNRRLSGTGERQIFAEMAKRCHSEIEQTIDTDFEVALPTDRATLSKQLAKVEVGLHQLERYRHLHKLNKENSVKYQSLMSDYSTQESQLKAIEARLSQSVEDFYGEFHDTQHDDQISLFELSLAFLTQEALRRKEKVLSTLSLYQGILPGDSAKARNIQRMEDSDLDEHLRLLSLVFPVATSTLLSVRNMLPWVKKCISLSIIDEAGMIPMHLPFPLLVRSDRATVVGDPFQIQPIINQSDKAIERYYNTFFKSGRLESEDFYRYSPSETKLATAYHRAAGANGQPDDVGNGIALKEHYRCHPDIIGFSNSVIPYGLQPFTGDEPSLIGPNLLAYHTDGTMKDKVNTAEVDAVKKVVIHLIEKGYKPQEIGVVSAFKSQADRLKKVLTASSIALDTEAVGTVHTFQGSERRVIVLSTKVCRQKDNISWFDRTPNLLNVAVSRAKELFVLVGDLHLLTQKGSYTRELVNYIKNHGTVLEYHQPETIPAQYSSSEHCETVYDCTHLAVLDQALDEAKEDLCIIAPRIRGDAALYFIAAAKSALEKGINVTVRYGLPPGLDPEEEASEEEKALRHLFASYAGAQLIKVNGEGTRRNILICDRKFAVMGSWRWLSHVYSLACEKEKVTKDVQLCEESSVLIRDPHTVRSLREKHGLAA